MPDLARLEVVGWAIGHLGVEERCRGTTTGRLAGRFVTTGRAFEESLVDQVAHERDSDASEGEYPKRNQDERAEVEEPEETHSPKLDMPPGLWVSPLVLWSRNARQETTKVATAPQPATANVPISDMAEVALIEKHPVDA